MRKRIIATALALAASLVALAQEADTVSSGHMTLSQADKLVPRWSYQPLPSQVPPLERNAADTIDTGNPALKIILNEDGTWSYWKDGDVVMAEDDFNSHWSPTGANPYKIEYHDLPVKEYLWLVDSSDHYRFPGSVEPAQISSRFGRRHGRWHRGIDLRLPKGNPVYATFDGKVRVCRYVSGYGNLVVLRHESGIETFYGHLSKINVTQDQWVESGQVIGLAGSTGRSTGPHLHFEIRYKGFAIDPEWVIDFNSMALRHRVFVLKKKYLDPASKFVPESDMEEEEIAAADEADRLEAERIEAEMKAAKYHTIRSGDTLGGIAGKYGTSVTAICKLNGISSKTTLRIGRTLRVK